MENLSKENQIDEMARVLCGGIKNECEKCNLEKNCIGHNSAELLYNAGYRKASEVALEVIGDVEGYINRNLSLLTGTFEAPEINFGFMTLLKVQDYLAELKKKYTESEKDDDEM